MGWRAVHVEGAPNSFSRLIANRPESLNIHTALCSRSEPLHYVNGGPVGGFWEFMSENIKNAYHPTVNVATLPLVTCRPLSPLLEMFGITHVDLWILDVEGAELEVLRTFDFTRVTVDIVCVELDEGNPSKDNAVRTLLLESGFALDQRRVRNDWFVRIGFCGVRDSHVSNFTGSSYYEKYCGT
jgi:FkbM family methyltransferase